MLVPGTGIDVNAPRSSWFDGPPEGSFRFIPPGFAVLKSGRVGAIAVQATAVCSGRWICGVAVISVATGYMTEVLVELILEPSGVPVSAEKQSVDLEFLAQVSSPWSHQGLCRSRGWPA